MCYNTLALWLLLETWRSDDDMMTMMMMMMMNDNDDDNDEKKWLEACCDGRVWYSIIWKMFMSMVTKPPQMYGQRPSKDINS